MQRPRVGGVRGTASRPVVAIFTVITAALLLAACGPTPPATVGRWSKGAASGISSSLWVVSCPSSSAVQRATCVVVAGDNQAARGPAVRVTPLLKAPGATGTGVGPGDLSCASPSFCALAELDGRLPIFDGVGWIDEQVLDPDNSPTAVSCPVVGWCVAVDQGGQAFTYRLGTGSGTGTGTGLGAGADGAGWSAPTAVPGGGTFVGISCTSTTFCLAVTSDSQPAVLAFDGSGWSSMAAPTPSTPQGGSEPNVLNDVACASARFCVAVDTFGEYFVWNGSKWSSPTRFGNLQDVSAEVSCHSDALCMVVDEDGGATPISDGHASARQVVVPGDNGLNDVSCPSADGCVAVGSNGKVYTYAEDKP